MNEVIAILPARMASERLPGKPLVPILGKPMIIHVLEQVSQCKFLDDFFVATDSRDVLKVIERLGFHGTLTGESLTGTDRCFLAMKELGISSQVVINVQGDEPIVSSNLIDEIARRSLSSVADIVTPFRVNNIENLLDPRKVSIAASNNKAVYFSRNVIPYGVSKFKQHIGLYGYKFESLEKFYSNKKYPLEESEDLEQLRAIEKGLSIEIFETDCESIAVDVLEDVKLVEEYLLRKSRQVC